jgi:hypothetical protein
VDEVDERLLPVNFHDGYQFAVTRLEFGIAINSDFYELEVKFGFCCDQSLPCPLAEVAVRGVVEDDPRAVPLWSIVSTGHFRRPTGKARAPDGGAASVA